MRPRARRDSRRHRMNVMFSWRTCRFSVRRSCLAARRPPAQLLTRLLRDNDGSKQRINEMMACNDLRSGRVIEYERMTPKKVSSRMAPSDER